MNNNRFRAGKSARSHCAGESFWRDTLAAFTVDGQSVADFCRARGLKPPTFYAWRQRLAERDRGGDRHGVFPGPAFVPARIEPAVKVDPSTDRPFEVRLRGGRVLRLPASLPAVRLAEVLHALETHAEGRA